eukprot:m.291861 g.291861  ORF g.291861 m.291861 type:complete len:110 (+) comp15830_c0_seq4:3184-3513(+)
MQTKAHVAVCFVWKVKNAEWASICTFVKPSCDVNANHLSFQLTYIAFALYAFNQRQKPLYPHVNMDMQRAKRAAPTLQHVCAEASQTATHDCDTILSHLTCTRIAQIDV